jgi:hypothetical protein
MGKTHLRISDHAYLRYAERVLGFDRQEAHTAIREAIGGAVELCPDCRVPFKVGGEDYVGVVKNRTLLTIVPRAEMPPLPKPKRPKVLRPAKARLIDTTWDRTEG